MRAGHALSRALHLPAPTTDYVVHRGVPVPMRDGVELLADHYEPPTAQPGGHPAGPRALRPRFPFSALFGSVYAARGYHVRVPERARHVRLGRRVRRRWSTRSTTAPTPSPGCATSPGSPASFATIGLSYLGFTQWALLADPPPELTAAIITVGPHDFARPRGAPGRSRSTTSSAGATWSPTRRTRAGSGRRPAGAGRAAVGARRDRSCRSARPAGRCSATGAPWYESWLDHPDPDDPYWAPLQLHRRAGPRRHPGAAAQRLAGPVPRADARAVPRLCAARRADRADRRPVDAHPDDDQGRPDGAPRDRWTGWTLIWRAGPRARPAVRCGSTSPATAGWTCPTGRRRCPSTCCTCSPARPLGDTAPTDTRAGVDVHLSTPPTRRRRIGGRLLSPEGGYRDDTALAERADVLTFTGDPLPADLYVVGRRSWSWRTRATTRYDDVFVRLSEVDAKGRSRNVSDGYRRARQRDSGTVRLELDAVAHRFRAGSRIRLLVAGGSHPRFARNLGTGEPPSRGRRLRAGDAHRAPRRRRDVAAASCPRARGRRQPTDGAPARRSPAASRRRAPVSAHVGSTGMCTQLVQPA